MKSKVKELLAKVRSTPDFGYVRFDDINDTNELGSNALHCVVAWDDVEAARLLIEAGINVNQRGEEGETPLFSAISYGNMAMIKLLLESGADPLVRPDGHLPFTFARMMKRDDICDLISLYSHGRSDLSRERHARHLQRLDESIRDMEKQIHKECGDESA